MKTIRTLVVDDEPFARKKLHTLLQDEPDFEIVGDAGNGKEAIELIRAQKPDLMFLDIQMPEMDGFQTLETLGEDERPAIVFVTAFDQFALRAFELHALDYLLKPFDHERLQKTLNRVRRQFRDESSEEINAKLNLLLSHLKEKPKYLQRLMIKASGNIYFLKTDEIDWIEAAGNYVTLYTGKKTHLLRETMTSLTEKLDPEQFVRIHRSQIVNIDRIQKLQTDLHGDYVIKMHTGKELTLTRTYRDSLLKHFESEKS